MIEVRALASFEHSGKRLRGERFFVIPKQAAQLAAKGLIEKIAEETGNPKVPAGIASSVSPAGRVLPRTTLSASGDGVKRKRGRPRKNPEPSL
jgi:hypothetical protein